MTTNQDTIREKVTSAVRSVTHRPYVEIPLDTNIEELANDSIDQVALLFELEAALGVELADYERLAGVKTLGDLVEKMRSLVAA
jgi:acyl carrier protein